MKGRDGDRLGQLKRQLCLGRQSGIVLLLLLVAALVLSSLAFAIGLSLVFVGWTERVGRQVVGFSVDRDGSENHLQFVVLHGHDAASDVRAFREHGLAVELDWRSKARGERVALVILVAGKRLAYGCGNG